MKLALVRDAEPPLVDRPRLKSIKDLGLPGDADGFVKGLLDIFFERAPALMNDLAQALDGRDSHKVEKLAHALKGTAGNLGASRMMHLAERLESLGRSRSLEGEAVQILEALKASYPDTRHELLREYKS